MQLRPGRTTVRWRTGARLLVQVPLSVLIAVTVVAQNRPVEPSLQGEGSLKAMTYNMYVGTEYGAGLVSPDPTTFLQAVDQLISDVRASDPEGRVEAVARQIAGTRPRLVGLQEVALWGSGPTKDTLAVEFDFLQLLLDALSEQGAQYTPVATLPHFDVTLPGSSGYVRNAWRVVILARADMRPEDLSFANVVSAPWSSSVP